MVPKCHQANGASYTTSKDQIHISFSLDRNLLQSFTAGSESSTQLELLLMNTVLTQCLGSLTMTYLSQENRQQNKDIQKDTSPSRKNKRRKISKAKDYAKSETSSRTSSDAESECSVATDDDRVKESNNNEKPNIPPKVLEFASVQHVVSDLAAAAAKDNNNLPLNLSSQFHLSKRNETIDPKFLNLVGKHQAEHFSSICKSEAGSEPEDDFGTESDFSSNQGLEMQVDDTAHDSHSLLSPSLLQSEEIPTSNTKNTNVCDKDLENNCTAVVTPAAAPSGPVSTMGLEDDCDSLKLHQQTLNDIILEGMRTGGRGVDAKQQQQTNTFSSRNSKELKTTLTTTTNSQLPDTSIRNFHSSSSAQAAATLGLLSAAQLLSASNFVSNVNNASSNKQAINTNSVSTNAAKSALISSQSHQLSSLIASLTSSNANMTNQFAASVAKATTKSSTSNLTTDFQVSNPSNTSSCSSVGGSPNSVNSSSFYPNASTPRRGQKSLVCEFGCGYETPDATLLKSHHVSHSNDRPYQCSYCGHSFKRNHTLLRHIRQVHKIDTTSATGEPILTVASMVPPAQVATSVKSSPAPPSLVSQELSLLNEKLKKDLLSAASTQNLVSHMSKTTSRHNSSICSAEDDYLDEEEDFEFGLEEDQKPMDLAISADINSNKPPSLVHCSLMLRHA